MKKLFCLFLVLIALHVQAQPEAPGQDQSLTINSIDAIKLINESNQINNTNKTTILAAFNKHIDASNATLNVSALIKDDNIPRQAQIQAINLLVTLPELTKQFIAASPEIKAEVENYYGKAHDQAFDTTRDVELLAQLIGLDTNPTQTLTYLTQATKTYIIAIDPTTLEDNESAVKTLRDMILAPLRVKMRECF